MWSTSQNPYPFYDQSLRFLLPYLCPNQKFDSLFMTVEVDTVALNISYEGLIDNDQKVASSKKHTQFKTRVLEPYAIYNQNGQNRYLIYDQNG